MKPVEAFTTCRIGDTWPTGFLDVQNVYLDDSVVVRDLVVGVAFEDRALATTP